MKKNIPYRDQLIKLSKLYKIDEVKNYIRSKKNLRLIDTNNLNTSNTNNFVSNFSSILVQSPDINKFKKKEHPHFIDQTQDTETDGRNDDFNFNRGKFHKKQHEF